MFRSIIKERKAETSVLNTDSFDKRRFKQIFEMSKGLQEIEHKEDIPLFKELLSDIWAGLFKMSPKIKDEIPSHLEANAHLMNKIIGDELFQEFREKTVLDDTLSAIGTINFGRKTQQWLNEQREENEELDMQIDELNNQLQKMSRQLSDGNENVAEGNQQGAGSVVGISNEMKRLAEMLNDSLSQNDVSFARKMHEAAEDTMNAKKGLEALFGGVQAGSGDAVPLRQKIEIAERISYNPKMKEIAKWAGRFTKIARTKQKMKHKESTEQSGIEQGSDLERVLPSELVQYTNSVTKNDFLKRFAEGQLMQYEQKGKESLGQGSIIVCLDQSGSMQNLDSQSKGFVLALVAIAKRQKRNFAYIPFSDRVGGTMQFPKGKMNSNDIVKVATEFLNGGTKFEPPLKEGLKIINKDSFNDADIIFVTDGEANIAEKFLQGFYRTKSEKKFNVLSLAIGQEARTMTLKRFSDKVVQISDLNDDGAFEAFEV